MNIYTENISRTLLLYIVFYKVSYAVCLVHLNYIVRYLTTSEIQPEVFSCHTEVVSSAEINNIEVLYD